MDPNFFYFNLTIHFPFFLLYRYKERVYNGKNNPARLIHVQKLMIAGCLVTATLVGVENPSNSWLSKKDWESFLLAKKCDCDALLLNDGTQLTGQIEKLPTLAYSFANLSFNPEKVALVALAETGQGIKLQIVTRDGQNYLASLGTGKMIINIAEEGKLVKKEIDPKKVRLIVLKERGSLTNPAYRTISSIELRNGDHLPAIIADEPLVLTDGWREMSLLPSEIIELSFNGGVHGSILKGGLPTALNFKFIKEPSLNITIPQSGEKITLHWEKIEAISTFNGGFRAGDKQRGSLLNLLSDHIKNVYGNKSESFGNTKGTLLEGASGALALPPHVFVGLAELGTEQLGQPEPLFDNAEEAQWNLHIAFEETSSMLAPFEQVAMLDPDQIREIKEALVFDGLQKVDFDPPTFDVPPPPKDEDKPLLAVKDDDLNDEELELLEGLLAQESLPKKVLEAVKPSNSIDSALIRKGMVYVAEGKVAVQLENPVRRAVLIPTTGKPTLLVKVPSFYIDRNPITNSEYQIFVLATKYPSPPHWGGSQVPKGLEQTPVVNVSYKDAEKYAAWAGRRLPTQFEWESAIKGKEIHPTQKLKEWSSSNASANSRLVLAGHAFVTRNEHWLDYSTGFRTIAD